VWEALSCLLTHIESFKKGNPEMLTDSVARQMHQKTVQHYWVMMMIAFIITIGEIML